MDTKQAVFVTALSMAGGFLGAAVFSSSGLSAKAQVGGSVHEVPYQGGDTRNELVSTLFIPDSGLKFMTKDIMTVGWLGPVGDNMVFTLCDTSGNPSITMTAGPGGKVEINALPGGAGIAVSSPESGSQAGIFSDRSRAEFFSTAGGSTAQLSSGGGGSSLSIFGPAQTPAFKLSGDSSGGSLTMFGDGRMPAVTIDSSAAGGQIEVRDAQGMTKASISGEGRFVTIKDGKVVWQGPSNKGG